MTKLYRVITCSEDVLNYRRVLVMEWSLHSLLSLSIDKCKAMCVSLYIRLQQMTILLSALKVASVLWFLILKRKRIWVCGLNQI